MPTAEPSDEQLVLDLRGGDLDAFDVLYRRWERRLFGYVRRTIPERELAEDLFQDVFLTVLRDRSYDPNKGRFSAWLFTVARNRCNQELRRQKVRDAADERRADPGGPDDPDDAVDRLRRVRAAMDELTGDQRQLLLLKEVAELTYREIAAMHGVAEGTIKSRLHAAMKAFRQRLAQSGGG